MRTALFGLCLLAVLAAVPSSAKDDPPAFRIESFEVVDLVGDPLITPESLGGLFDAMLDLGSFVSYRNMDKRRSEFEVEGVHRIANVLHGAGDAPDAAAVTIVVEIESVYYGPKPENVGEAVAKAWFFGPILAGAFDGDSDLMMGMVQCRATVHSPDFEEDVVTVGQGAVIDPVADLSRRRALDDSARRAVWDLMFAVVSDMNETWDLDVDKKFESIEFEDYEEAVEKWWDER